MKTQDLLPGVRKQIKLFRRDYRNGKQLADRYLEFINLTEDKPQKKTVAFITSLSPSFLLKK